MPLGLSGIIELHTKINKNLILVLYDGINANLNCKTSGFFFEEATHTYIFNKEN